MFKYKDKLIAVRVLMPTTQKVLEKQLSIYLDYREVIDYGPKWFILIMLAMEFKK